MKRWASIHPGSGAILAISTNPVIDIRSNLSIVEASAVISGELHWWNGLDFVPRQPAEISLPTACAQVGELLDLTLPQGGWYMRTNGTIDNAEQVTVDGGYKENRFTLMGRYCGETAIEVVAAGAGLDAVRTERDRLLKETDIPFMVSDFPISQASREALRLYRSALRDVPEVQPNANLATVVWPAKPGDI